jgi:hypothetical protein
LHINIRHWLVIVVLSLSVGACGRVQPIYTVQDHPLPAASHNLTSDQVTHVIIQMAQANGWLVDRLGPNELRATQKWRDHSATVLISHDDKSFSIRNESSTNLLQDNGNIHRAYNERVRKLEAAIERQLYRNP